MSGRDFWSSAHTAPLQLAAVPSPSILVAVAAFGTSPTKRLARGILVASIASLCHNGLNAGLVVDAANIPRNEWPEALAAYGCRTPGNPCNKPPLWCSRRGAAVEVRLTMHNASIGHELPRLHLRRFLANRDRFDWFLYTEDDTGWVPSTLRVLMEQFRLLAQLLAMVSAQRIAHWLCKGYRFDLCSYQARSVGSPTPPVASAAAHGAVVHRAS